MSVDALFEPKHAPKAPDYSRYDGMLAPEILRDSTVTFVGVGGSSGLVRNLASMGVNLIVIDPDTVGPENVPTQGFRCDQVGESKAKAVAEDAWRTNPDIDITALPCRFEDLTPEQQTTVWDANLVFAVTDSFAVNAAVNKEAVSRGVDLLSGCCYQNCVGIEVTGSFPDAKGKYHGCHRCYTDPRHRWREEGLETPRFYARHPFIAELLNNQLGTLAVSLRHLRAGSDLPITKHAARFMANPLLITRFDPDFYAGQNEMFSDISDDYGALVSRHWYADVPGDFVCPDCGTPAAELG